MKWIMINQNKRINELKEYLKNTVAFIITTLLILNSINVNAQKTKLADKEVAYINADFRNGMASFVESVKPIYTSGMSYNTFRSRLIGANVKNITGEGEALLNKAFNYLVNSRSSSYISKNDSCKEKAFSLIYAEKYNIENNINNGDMVLFGNTTGNPFPSDTLLYKLRKKKTKGTNIYKFNTAFSPVEINDRKMKEILLNSIINMIKNTL